MTDTKLWKIIHNETSGWNNIEEQKCVKLTKEQCKKRLDELITHGYNPTHLKAVPDA